MNKNETALSKSAKNTIILSVAAILLGGVFLLRYTIIKKQERTSQILNEKKLQLKQEQKFQESVWPHSYLEIWEIEKKIRLLDRQDSRDTNYKKLKKQILKEYNQNHR